MILYNKNQIPPGCYCYTYIDNKLYVCPFWHKAPDKREQENGYCAFLSKGDWEENGTFLLWDQCKECGINDEGK
jgi:hypothetical protein